MTLSHPQLRLLISLLSALSKHKHGIACLRHVFFTPVTGHTLISATDLDLQLYWPLPLTGESLERPTSCPIDWFLKAATAVRPSGHLDLRPSGQHLAAYPNTGPSSRSPEPAIPLKDAPGFTTQDFTLGGWLSHPTLEKAAASIPFISTDETRYVLNGAFISTTGHIVATDGRKLAHAPTRGTQLPRDIILPTRMIKAFEALANGTVTATGVNHEPEHLRMQAWLTPEDKFSQLLACHSGCYLRAKLIEGQYPNWRQVLPGSFSTLVDVSPEFLAILKVTLARSTDKKLTQVLLDLQSTGTVIARIYQSGTGKDRTDLIDPCAAGTHTISPDQPLFQSCFNAGYLLHCLTFAGLRLYCTDEKSPLRSGSPDAAQTVLMPMRVNG